LYNLAFGITVLPASLLMGALWNWRGPRTAFLVSAVLGGSAALLLLLLIKAPANGKPPKNDSAKAA
jgi:predicted MFS family arabinose efflux permease